MASQQSRGRLPGKMADLSGQNWDDKSTFLQGSVAQGRIYFKPQSGSRMLY